MRVSEQTISARPRTPRDDIADFRPHDLRHTCAAWLVQAGVALAVMRDLLGHASIEETERYAHLAPANIRQAVAVLDGGGLSRSGHAATDALPETAISA